MNLRKRPDNKGRIVLNTNCILATSLEVVQLN